MIRHLPLPALIPTQILPAFHLSIKSQFHSVVTSSTSTSIVAYHYTRWSCRLLAASLTTVSDCVITLNISRLLMSPGRPIHHRKNELLLRDTVIFEFVLVNVLFIHVNVEQGTSANCNTGQLICLVSVIHFCRLCMGLPPYLCTSRFKVIYRVVFAGGSPVRSCIYV